jgi:hypothetical protein
MSDARSRRKNISTYAWIRQHKLDELWIRFSVVSEPFDKCSIALVGLKNLQ